MHLTESNFLVNIFTVKTVSEQQSGLKRDMLQSEKNGIHSSVQITKKWNT